MEHLWTLFAVIVGGGIALLSPWASHLIDKRVKRIELKRELIRDVYVFYATSTQHILLVNWLGYYTAKYNLLDEFKSQMAIGDPTLPEIEKRLAFLLKLNEDTRERASKSYDYLVEVEGRLQADGALLDTAFQAYPSRKIFDAIRKIINELSINDNTHFFNYNEIVDLQAMDDLVTQMGIQGSQKSNELRISCDALIEKIIKTLT